MGSDSCVTTPTLTPNPSPAPPGGKGELTAICGRVFEGGEFKLGSQHSKRPSIAVFGNGFEVMEFTVKN